MTIEVTAKKVEDAINQGLEQLGASMDEVNIEVLETGGLFRKAKVRLTLEREDASEQNSDKEKSASEDKQVSEPVKADKQKQQKPVAESSAVQKAAEKPVAEKAEKAEKAENKKPAAPKKQKAESGEVKKEHGENAKPQSAQKKQNAENGADSVNENAVRDRSKPRKLSDEDKAAAAHALEFVKEVAQKMGFADLTVEANDNPELIQIIAPSGDDSLIIGRHGETLSALSYLAETCARAEKCHLSITVDCNGYRDRRAASLTAMAKRKADECIAKHRKIKLDPMDRVDRRTVHSALTDDGRVSTASEGKEPYRYVVIFPNKNK